MWSKHNAFNEVEGVQRLLDRLAGESRHSRRPSQRFSFLPGFSARSYPLVNVYEDVDHVYVEALAPGVDPKSLELSVTGDQLRISGEKPASDAGIDRERVHRNERGAGKFIRILTLPREVDDKGIEAEYRNGVLSVKLPKSAAAKPRQIAVQVK